LNSNSKPNLESNNGEEMKKKERRKEEEGLPASCLAQPAQPTTGPALHISSPLAHARAVAGRPQLARNSPACGPATPTRPQLSCGRCHLAPRVSRAPLFPSPAAAANGPHSSAFSLFIFSTPTSILPSDRTPTALAGSGPGDHAQGMALPPLAPRPRNPSRSLDASSRPDRP